MLSAYGTAPHEVLDAWVAARGVEPGPLVQQVTKGGVVTGRAMSGQAITALLERLRKRAGVKPFTPHDMRRAYVTSHLDRGTDAVLVATRAVAFPW